jgi:uncharacterized protein (DUF1330 family)
MRPHKAKGLCARCYERPFVIEFRQSEKYKKWRQSEEYKQRRQEYDIKYQISHE